MAWHNLSKWIWLNEEQKNDTYGEFYTEFVFSGKEADIRISADSNYTFFLNGKYVYSGQYSDFPSYKVYDEISLKPYIREGVNKLSIVVWYYGKSNLSYYPGNASLRFEVYDEEKILAYSSEKTKSRRSKAYKNEYQKEITVQLGYSFLYDITKEDNWKSGELIDFNDSKVLNHKLPLFIRPVERNVVGEIRESKLIKQETNYYLYDLGCEEVGFLNLKVKSDKKQKLTICYGEHIVDGGVRSKIGSRDFSLEVIVGEGINDYINYFRRLGLRYLEVHTEYDADIEFINIIKCQYPITQKEFKTDNPLHQRIYDTAVRTLTLCMHEHYEDCPWREQGLYAMDSRNQMLCGYYAFEETKMQRESLFLLAKSQREDGLLELTAPSVFDITIPSFSLSWIKALKEYLEHTNDIQFAKEMLNVAKQIILFFAQRCENGLIITPMEKKYWNFYEWTDKMNGFGESEKIRRDAPINAFFAIALLDYMEICKELNNENEKKWANDLYTKLKENYHKEFYVEKEKAYKTYTDNKPDHFAQLTQALSILGGLVPKEYEASVRKNVNSECFVEASLSYSIYKYDALLLEKDKYLDVVVKDIEDKWGYMLKKGATSFWETIRGESDFDRAGSLCHGWSAIPIYYFNEYKIN